MFAHSLSMFEILYGVSNGRANRCAFVWTGGCVHAKVPLSDKCTATGLDKSVLFFCEAWAKCKKQKHNIENKTQANNKNKKKPKPHPRCLLLPLVEENYSLLHKSFCAVRFYASLLQLNVENEVKMV